VIGCCERGNELLGPIKCGGFLNWLKTSATEDGPCCMELVYFVA
jgi:hypothetical protein